MSHNTIIIERKDLATHCFYCETPFEEILPQADITPPVTKTIDHFVPLCHRGWDLNKNKVICCWYCNHLKDHLRPLVFLDKLAGKDKRWKKWMRYDGFFTKEKIKIIYKNVFYLLQLNAEKRMNSSMGYYIKKEKPIPIQQRIYKPLTQWLTYGQK